MAPKPVVAPPQPSATELLQKDMVSLRAKNDSLTMVTAALERDKQEETARKMELESQLALMKEKITQAPAPRRVQALSVTPADAYQQAISQFRARRYADAASRLQELLDSGVPQDLEDNCHYWLGECSYALRKYQDALSQFNTVFTYKVSEKKDDAQMMIGNCFLAMGDKAAAKGAFQKLVDKFPASPYAKRAKEKLARL